MSLDREENQRLFPLPQTKVNCGGKKIFFTIDERLKIENFLRNNVSVQMIARKLNRSYAGIYNEINRAGGRENYTAEIANREFRRKFYREMEINDDLTFDKFKTLENNVNSLQEQMKILTDMVKELYVQKN